VSSCAHWSLCACCKLGHTIRCPKQSTMPCSALPCHALPCPLLLPRNSHIRPPCPSPHGPGATFPSRSPFAVSRSLHHRLHAPRHQLWLDSCSFYSSVVNIDFLAASPACTLIKNSVMPPPSLSQRHFDYSPATTATSQTVPPGASIPIALLGSRNLRLYQGKLCFGSEESLLHLTSHTSEDVGTT
jgi:hypothetical protein